MSRIVRSGLVVFALLLSLLVVPTVAGATPGPGNSDAAKLCQNGGYTKYTRSDGTTFKNNGACASYAAQGGTLVPLSPCFAEAVRAGVLDPDANPGDTNFVAGTAGDDNFTGRATAGPDVFCGFGGGDQILQLDAGDTFLGGAGTDSVGDLADGGLRGGTFYGDDGIDYVNLLLSGTFDGGDSRDVVGSLYGGTFDGGAGDDNLYYQGGGTFDGGAGNDSILNYLVDGTFNGGDGADSVGNQLGGTFNGGEGNDEVLIYIGGTSNP